MAVHVHVHVVRVRVFPYYTILYFPPHLRFLLDVQHLRTVAKVKKKHDEAKVRGITGSHTMSFQEGRHCRLLRCSLEAERNEAGRGREGEETK